jgi:hypothetical protein
MDTDDTFSEYSEDLGGEMRSSAKNRLSVLVSVFLLMGSAGVANAQTNISNSPNWISSCPRLAVDSAGNVHAVWAEFYSWNGPYPATGDAFYSKYTIATNQWSTPVNLSNSGHCASGEALSVGIDADASGNVYVVYVDQPSVKLRILSGGSWSAPFDVGSASSIDGARIAVDAQGNIYICCYLPDSTVYSRARVGGVWESAAILSASPHNKFPEISVGTNQVYCVYESDYFHVNVRYEAVIVHRAKTFGAAWSSPQKLTTAGVTEEHPAIKVDANDVAHVVYTPDFGGGSRDVRYVEGTSSGFSTPIVLGSVGGVHYPFLTVRGTNVYACWQSYGVHYRNRVDGVWAAEAGVPNSSVTGCGFTDVAASPSQGKIYYVWENSDIYFAELPGPGPFAPPNPEYWIAAGDMNGDDRVDVLGTCSGVGTYYRDSISGAWVEITVTASQVTSGDLDGDGTDDLIGMWPQDQGIWVKFSSTGTWAQLDAAKADWIGVGDINGDGRKDFIGTWSGFGVYYRDSVSGIWYKITSPAQKITAGDLDGDGADDLIGIWPDSEGTWVRFSGSTWAKIDAANADWIGVGDMNGDGRTDFIGTYSSLGVYYRDSLTGSWVKYTAPAEQITAGDLDGDRTDDLIGIWPGDPTVWAKLSGSNAWVRLISYSGAASLTAEKMVATEVEMMRNGSPRGQRALFGGKIKYSPLFGEYEDLSANGRGRAQAQDRTAEWGIR